MERWDGQRGALRPAAVGLALGLVLFFLPGICLAPGAASPAGEEENQAQLPLEQATAARQDRHRAVRLLQEDGTVEETTMAEYLWCVVAAEMPASFEPEALKAQACAARTYTVRKQLHPSQSHPDADVCTDSSCCQAYHSREEAMAGWGDNAEEYAARIDAAVSATDGLGILYDGEPIQAVFFSSAAGRTLDAVEVWGNQVDYLVGVDSPEGDEVPNYHSQVTLSDEEVRQAVLTAYPGADLSGDPSGWFGEPTLNSAGGVAELTVGGVSLTGGEVRSLFGLRSATFTLTREEGGFRFDVTGYGHAVGMSQYGANAMAKEGSTFQDILTWYYTGTQVEALW